MLAHMSGGAGRSLLSAESAHGDLLHVHVHLLALVSQAPAASEILSLAEAIRLVYARHTKIHACIEIGCSQAPLACFV